MAEGVTYADLRFAKSAPEKSRPPRDAPDGPAVASLADHGDDGELTYENFAATRPRQPAGPQQQQRAVPGAAPRRIWPAALLGACLVLLAACLGLGVRYWQASQRQAAESSALAQRLGSQEENLTQALQQLSWAQAELDATRLALRQSWQVGNGTQREMEEEQRRSQSLLSRLQQEKEEATRELEAAKRVLGRAASCQQIDCCPHGWKLFREKCLWISSGTSKWAESKRDCEQEGARLLMLKTWDIASTTWDANTIWGAAVIMSHLQSYEFWIGLRREYEQGTRNEWQWRWVDGTPYTRSKKPDSYYGNCVKMSRGTLQRDYCDKKSLKYICEKAATPSSWSQGPNA